MCYIFYILRTNVQFITKYILIIIKEPKRLLFLDFIKIKPLRGIILTKILLQYKYGFTLVKHLNVLLNSQDKSFYNLQCVFSYKFNKYA